MSKMTAPSEEITLAVAVARAVALARALALALISCDSCRVNQVCGTTRHSWCRVDRHLTLTLTLTLTVTHLWCQVDRQLRAVCAIN